MNPSAIYSKSGKGVQEASGKTSLLKRADRAVLSAIDGRATVGEVAQKVGKPFDAAFQALITQLDRDGFVREVTAGAGAPGAAAGFARGPAAKPQGGGAGEDLDFTGILTTSSLKSGPSPKPADDTARRAKEQEQALYRARQEAEARAQQERERAREAEARARSEAEAKIRAETEAKFRAETERKLRAETEAKLKAEAEAKARAAREAAVRLAAEAKAKAEAEAQAKIEAERKAREEVERRAKEEAERVRREAEAAAQAKIEAERKAREEAERKAREEAEKARREAEELRQRLEEERKAREAEEKRRREEEERRRKEEEERRAREEAERKAREEAERKAREEEERRRREEEERRAREEAERQARAAEEQRRREEEERLRREEQEERLRREEQEERERLERQEAEARRAREQEEEERRNEEAEERRNKEAEERRREEAEAARRRQEQEAQARKAREEEEREEARAAQARKEEQAAEERKRQEREKAQERERAKEAEKAKELPKAAAAGAGGIDDLLSDIESFSEREAEEQKRKDAEAAERKARKEAEQKAQAEQRAKEEAERERKAAEERRRREEEEARAREEAERREREEEERIQEAARKRKAEAAAAAAAAPQGTDDDIGVTDEDLDMDDVRKDEAQVSKESRKAQREREREARKREKEARERERAWAKERERAATPYKPARVRRPRKWGKAAAVTLFLVLAAGVGWLHVMPLPVDEYERAASQALGQPVRIDSGRLSLFTGVTLNLSGVTIGEHAKIATVRAHPRIGSLFDESKAFDRIELEGVTLAQEALAQALFAPRAKGPNFSVERVTATNLKLEGPVALPPLAADLRLADDGSLRVVRLDGPEGLSANLTPKQDRVEFDVTAASFTLPFAKEVSLGSFAMKGIATRQGMRIEAWGGTLLDGALSGTANVRWGRGWQVDGVMTARGLNAAVFAPALISRGKVDGTGKFLMSGTEPAKLAGSSRIEGSFSIEKGVLGSFDLSRALQTDGRQANGRTEFSELSGQGTYERGAVALRNVSIGAGALTAGASADIAQDGALSGRIVADIRTASQALRTTLLLGGTVRDPQVRN